MAVMTLIMSYSFFIGCKKEPVLPTVTTGAISQITENSASGSGETTADGGADITLKGLCWSTTPDPTVLNMFMNATTTGIGGFDCNLVALQPNTQYYVRAFAINEVGTVYGNTITFTTLESEVPDNIPVVTTSEVSEIDFTSAVCGGTITSDAGSTITSRGVCWSENSTPTIADNKTVNGTGAGSFTSDIAGLTTGTTYYVRAYATNANGTGYGSAMSFTTTQTGIPTVTTQSISNITTNSAISGGNITDDGNSSITARGVCWSTNSNPTIADNHTSDGTGEGIYNSNMSGLNHTTTYYVRAYATNSEGTGYGNSLSFVTAPLNLVTFTVTDYFGNSITGASINIASNTIITNTSGIATISLEDGIYDYTVTKSGYIYSENQDLTINSDKDVSVVLYRGIDVNWSSDIILAVQPQVAWATYNGVLVGAYQSEEIGVAYTYTDVSFGRITTTTGCEGFVVVNSIAEVIFYDDLVSLYNDGTQLTQLDLNVDQRAYETVYFISKIGNQYKLVHYKFGHRSAMTGNIMGFAYKDIDN